MPPRRNKRGPQRARNSRVKVACAFKQCRSGRDCKNIPPHLQVKRAEVDVDKCRPIRTHSAYVKFCCASHMKKCCDGVEAATRGPREVLDELQVVYLFRVLVERNASWAAVLMLFQVFLAERADAMRRAQVGWLLGFNPNDACPPSIKVPGVNGKTVARTIAVSRAFADLIYNWMHKAPLKAGKCQWPCKDAPLQKSKTCLFPGMHEAGSKKCSVWSKAMSERAYLGQVRSAANFLQKERAQFRRAGRDHAMDDCDLSRLGTHSFKRTGVSLLKDKCRSTAVVSSISGTSQATLERVYDTPTAKRQRSAGSQAFDGIVAKVKPPAKSKKAAAAKKGSFAIKFCAACGKERVDQTWMACPFCGRHYGV